MGSIAKQENGHLGAEILVPDQRGGEPETEAPKPGFEKEGRTEALDRLVWWNTTLAHISHRLNIPLAEQRQRIEPMVDKLMAQAHSLLSQALEKEARRQVRARLDTEARQWAERALDRLSLVEQDIRAVALERTQKKLGRFLQDGGQKVPQAEVSYVVQDEMLRVLGQMVGDVDELLKESATALPSGSATVAHMEPRVSEAPPAPSPEAALSRERGTPVGLERIGRLRLAPG